MSVDINVYLNKKPKNFEVWLLEQGFEKKQYDKEISYAKDGVEVALDVEDFEISGDIRKALDRNETNFPEKAAATVCISTSANRNNEAIELQEQLPFMIKEEFGGVVYDPQGGKELR